MRWYLLGLFHDTVITVGLLSFFRFDFSLTTVAAILTLVGYSVNDKVVTYDRIRENLKKYRKMPQEELINKSVNDIFSRTILTGVTTLVAVIPLYLWGGDAFGKFCLYDIGRVDYRYLFFNFCIGSSFEFV